MQKSVAGRAAFVQSSGPFSQRFRCTPLLLESALRTCNAGLPTDQPRRKWFDGVVVGCALEDHEGNLWLGTAHSGLWRLRPRAVFWTVAVPARLKNVAVMIRVTLVEDHAGYGGTVAGLLNTTSGLTCVAACPSARSALADRALSPHTILTHVRHIYEKLHVRSRTWAVTKWLGR